MRGSVWRRWLAAIVVVSCGLAAARVRPAAAVPAPDAPEQRAPRLDQKSGAPEVDPSTVLVKFAPGTGLSDAAQTAERHSAEISQAVPGTGYTVLATNGTAPDALVAQLESDPTVVDAQPNYIRHALDIPNDDLFAGFQAPYLNTIHAPQAWSVSHGSLATKIAVLDTGIDLANPEFAGRIVPNSGWDFVNNDATPQDDDGHGTEVASIAAARTNNGTGIAGLAWDASIIPVKVLDSNGSGSDADIAAGITWATDQGARIINMSLGGIGDSSVLHSAVAYALDHDVVVVAAAGNASSTAPFFPAAQDGVIAVAATDANGDAAWFSQHGAWVDLAAPGIDIAGAYLNGGFVTDSGTSFASPIVSGIAALVRTQHPNWTQAQVLSWLEATATDHGPPGLDDSYGFGVVDAWAAVGGPGAGRPGVAPGDALEPNDTPDRARAASVPSSVTSTISPEEDSDWFSYVAPGNGRLTFTVTPPPASGSLRAAELDPVVAVYDSNNSLLATADNGGVGVAETAAVGVGSGSTYRVLVQNFAASKSPGSYTVSAAFSNQSLSTPPGEQLWVRSTTPADVAAGFSTTGAPTVTFARSLNAGSVTTQSVQLIDGVSGSVVATTPSYNSGNKTVTLTPAAPLETNHAYQVHVGAVKDSNSNTFTDGYTFRFTSAPPPSFPFPVVTFYQRDINAPGAPDNTIPFGSPGCVAVSGDWDGDGTSTIGVYCNGTWYLRNSNTPGGVDVTPFAFGTTGYVPVVGDWNGDGTDGIGVYVNGMWYLRDTLSGGAPQHAFAYGTTGYTPVVGDWNGDGQDGIGVYVNGSWYLRDTPTPGAPQYAFAYGTTGYRPVVGNWDGAGGDSIGVVTGPYWYLRNTNGPGPPDGLFAYGDSSYQLVPGDWDGDKVTTPAVAVG